MSQQKNDLLKNKKAVAAATETAEVNRNIYCMAQHLQSFVEDAKYDRIADFGRPCASCKYLDGCDLDFYSKSKTLTKITSIRFSPLASKKVRE